MTATSTSRPSELQTPPAELEQSARQRSPRLRPATTRTRRVKGVSTARALAWLISVVSGCALFFVLFLLVLSSIEQSRSQTLLYTQFRSELAAATAPFGVDPIPPGDPVALIVVPSLGIRQVVVEGTSGEDLRSGPGHLRLTTLPGQLGTSVIFGRSTTYGAPFRDLPSLHPGDPLQVTTGQGIFAYQVEDVRRDGDPQPPVLQANQSRLLLVTTDSGTLGALSTVYIDALLVSKPAVTPPRAGMLVPDYEGELASDPTALLPLALWLFVLIGAAAFAAWGLSRWGRSQTWLVTVPVVLVALWGASDSAAMLLPNLM